MKFNLNKDIVFFDLEATGLNVIRDRIVQIALIKYEPDNEEAKTFVSVVNPEMPIPDEAAAIHGLTDDMVADKPNFGEIAQDIFDFIGDADLSGYNSNRFDIPMLIEELARVDLELDMSVRRTIDVQRIFYKMEPRTLSAALKFYCDKGLENAHDALADVEATIDVLKGQIQRYQNVNLEDENGGIIKNPVQNDMEALYKFTSDVGMIDATNRLKYNSKGVMVFNFGKFIGKPVLETIVKDRQYYDWIMHKDFSYQVKQTLRKLMDGHLKDQMESKSN